MIDIKVNLQNKEQLFEGWGTALCWWANVVGNWQDDQRIQEVCDLVFHPQKGLGFNIARYNFGSGIMANPRFRVGANIPSYGTAPDTWDMEADKGQRRILKEAMKRGVDITEGFFNSPPVWMTNSQSTAGSQRGDNNLRSEYYQAYVDYVTTLLMKLRNTHDLSFHTLSLFNEPTSSWWIEDNNQEGCHFSVESQSQILKLLKKTFKEEGMYDIIISGGEGWSTHESIMMYHDYQDEVRDMIGQVNTHTYGVDNQTREQLQKLAAMDHKKLYMSEVCFGADGPQNQQSMDTGLMIAESILADMKILKPNGWVYWQAIEDKDLDHNYGFLHVSFTGQETYDITKSYYVMGQFSRYIRPGARIIGCDIDRALCAYHEKDESIALVLVNDEDQEKHYTLHMPEGFYLHEMVRTSRQESLGTVDRDSKEGNRITCPEKSVTTLLFYKK